VLAADRWGKHKTIWQIIAILYFFILLTLDEIFTRGSGGASPSGEGVWVWIGNGTAAVALLLTVGSGLGYLWKNRALIADY
jgi:phosphatidylglycerophosphate synthase